MKLYLQRHSDAEDGEQMDSARQLTGKGRVDAEDMAMFMQRQIGRVDTVICSPFTRATETADIMAPVLGCDLIVTTTALEPDGTPEGAWAEIERLAGAAEDILVVTHGPLVHELLAWLLEPHYQPGDGKTGIKFGFGECAAVHIESGHQGKLHWFCSHGIAQRDRDEKEIAEAARAFVEAAGIPLKKPLPPPEPEEDDEDEDEAPVAKKKRGLLPGSGLAKLGLGATMIGVGQELGMPAEFDGAHPNCTCSAERDGKGQKRWVLGDGGKAGNCEMCIANADQGWIDEEDTWDGVFGAVESQPLP